MDDLSSIKSFNDLKLNSWLIRQCQTFGVRIPTEIQKAVIPHILNGEDCIGCAKTGSGKTLAFALPILQKWCEDPYGIFALVLTPTRELAYQIGDQFIVLGKPMNLRVSIITGGIDMLRQGLELSTRPHIVIATPGRLADHMEACNTFSLARVKYLVLDEADRLLGAPGGNFDLTLKQIFAALPQQKQTLLFSATMTDTLEQVKSITKKQVFVWESKQEVATVEELDQYYVLCPYDIKDGYLVETVRLYREKSPSGSIVIFTDTCRSCQVLSMMLNDIGLRTVALHGMISQRQRLAALSQFKSNQVKILVATDVASRGLDIAGVELVVNYNIPPSPKDYIHRVGRTARAGRYGNAISLVTPYDIQLLKDVEEAVGTKLEEFSVHGKKVSEIYMQVSVTRREAELKLDETEFESRKNINKRKKLILSGHAPEEADEILRRMEEKKKKWLDGKKKGSGEEGKSGEETKNKLEKKSKKKYLKAKKLKTSLTNQDSAQERLENEKNLDENKSKKSSKNLKRKFSEAKTLNSQKILQGKDLDVLEGEKGRFIGSKRQSQIELRKGEREKILEVESLGGSESRLGGKLDALGGGGKFKRKCLNESLGKKSSLRGNLLGKGKKLKGKLNESLGKRKSCGMIWSECDTEMSLGRESEDRRGKKIGLGKTNSVDLRFAKPGSSDVRFVERSKKLGVKKLRGSKEGDANVMGLKEVKRSTADLDEIKDLLGI